MKILTRMIDKPIKVSTFTIYPITYYVGGKVIYSDKYYVPIQMNKPEFIKLQLGAIGSYWVGLHRVGL